MSRRWLHLRLSAPLMAFGDVAVDQVGPTRDFPAASALTGLLANALGWRWSDRDAHQGLQNRLIFGALIARQGRVLTDSQNARLYECEPGWTTRGAPETRNKGKSYSNRGQTGQMGNQAKRNGPYKWMTHQRRRDYLADHAAHVVLRLDPDDAAPGLDDLAVALDRPARPLFIGRKPCLPAARLNAGWTDGATARAALRTLNLKGRALWPEAEGAPEGARVVDLSDLRNWRSGLHGGSRRVVIGELP
jgi:CRISPR system Cascade subunit CasD